MNKVAFKVNTFKGILPVVQITLYLQAVRNDITFCSTIHLNLSKDMLFSKKFVTLSNKLTKRFRADVYKDYPVTGFEIKHVAHLVSLPDRLELLKHLPAGAVVAEIGVNEGDFSQQILTICNPQKLVLIDVWGSQRYHGGLFEKVKNRFQKEIQNGTVEIIRDLSLALLHHVPIIFSIGYTWIQIIRIRLHNVSLNYCVQK